MDVMRNSTHITSCAVVTCEHKGIVSPRRHNAATDQNKMCVSHADVDMGYKLHKGGRGARGFWLYSMIYVIRAQVLGLN